jgi:4-hydroxybenzoyl-CoA thioesterase
MARSGSLRLTVRWGEADPMGIAFYPGTFAWFDEATHRLFATSGRTLAARLREDGLGVPIAECGARFRAPVFVDDELVVTSTVAEVGPRSFRIEHVVARDGEEVASGFEVRVAARREEDGRLAATPLPDDLRAWLEGEG